MNLNPPAVLEHFLTFARLSALLASSIFILNACHSAADTSRIVEATKLESPSIQTANWIVLQVRFRSSASREAREASAKTIEQVLMDTIAAMRKTSPQFSPDLMIRKTPFSKDSTSVEYKVRYTIALPRDTVRKPPCLCPQCGICNLLILQPAPGSPIESFIIVPE